MRCSVVFAQPQRQWEWQLELAEGADLAQALAAAQSQAASAPDAPQIDWQNAKVGIFGVACGRPVRLNDGDRVEIYRPLAADPKESRRERARRLRQR
jgi:putative ubiquitin-RnfH superfamily antitoxin RatB of RatAB toxin-antitoxin module